MFRLILVLSLFLTNADAVADPHTDAVAILRTVIANETTYRGAPINNLCVVAATNGTTFGGQRSYRLYATKEAAEKESGVPVYGWKPENAKMLSEAIAAIWALGESEPLIPAIEADWLSPPPQFCTPADEWRTLTFTSPAIHGDIAFVYVDYKCPLCGHGVLYALRRVGSEWKIIDGATMWVS